MHPLRFFPLTFLAVAATVRADTVVVFNEIMYHPAAANAAAEEAAEWVELYNEMAVDVDLGGWSITGGVNYTFPEGTILAGGGYLVVAAVPANVPGSVGAWTGKLGNNGETLTLRNNNGRAMDEITYGTEGDWPPGADGGGASLAKRALNAATGTAASWRTSRTLGGTPGAENFPAVLPPVVTTVSPLGAAWKYEASGTDLGTGWQTEAFVDTAWPQGAAGFQLGTDPLPVPVTAGAALPSGPSTYYFRRTFQYAGNPALTSLKLRVLADDGAAVYLNGTELARAGLPSGTLTYSTPAGSVAAGGLSFREFNVPATALHTGANVLAVELHQGGPLPSYASAVLASGPVGYWRMGESAGPVTDLASAAAAPQSGAQNGTFTAMPATSLGQPGPRPPDLVNGQPLAGMDPGNAAPAFQGNGDGGDDVLLIQDPGVFNFGASKKFSLEAWVKGPAAQEGGGAIFAKGTGGGGEQFAIDVTTGYRFFGWTGASPNTPWVAQSAILPNNTWQYVVAVFDQSAGIARLYVNGVQAATVTPPATLVTQTHEVSIGARKGSAAAPYSLNFNGSVDEAAIYNRALSAAEITAHFNAAFVAGPTGPLDTTDAVFDLELIASETVPVTAPSPLVLNEVTLTGAEIMNNGGASTALNGMILRVVTSAGSTDQPLPAQPLGAGAFLNLPLALTDGSRLVLLAADGTVLDSAEVRLNPRVRYPDGTGPWMRPSASTPGAANAVALHSEIVINEIMYDHPSATVLEPSAPRAGQWIELHNKSAAAVNLTGWEMKGGIGFVFPAGTQIAAGGYLVLTENPAAFAPAHSLPAAQVLGPWAGNLSHGSDRLVLDDPSGNPADEVTYRSERPWPSAANAGGSSLELRDPRADNSAPESWAASDESGKAAWQTFTWRAANVPAINGEPTLWREIDLLLADGAGECLIDDVRVTDTTNNANLIANGDFSTGATGWRLLGNHRTSVVQPEPGNAGNSVLHVVASGPGEYQGNQIEATFVGNQALVANREYEISLRARWLSGAGRLNARLYFDRLARTHILNVVPNGGTPGAVNSRFIANAGPTYRNLSHFPVMPAASQPVTVSVEASDSDGMGAMEVKYSAAGGAWQTAAMTTGNGRTYTGVIPGQTSGAVQFYIEGRDTPGAISWFPARGQQSRAMYAVQDNQGTGPLQKVRLVMTPADATFLHTPVNTLSNEAIGCTVILNNSEVFYDTGVRLKGSFVGRNVARVGFNLLFNSDHLFRGVFDKVAVDRSQHTVVGGAGELIAKHIAAKAGGIPDMYDDLAQFIHPNSSYSSIGQLRIAGFEKEYLDTAYPKGGDGTMVEMEVFRWNLNTVDGQPTSPKLPGNEGGGTGYLNIDLGDYGTNKEAYRWYMLLTMNRDTDDYSRVIPFCRMFALNGAAFDAESRQRLDHDSFLRTMAYQSLVGPADAIYTGGNHHNCRFYFRPNDGKAMFIPWDWDSAWQRGATQSLIASGQLAKVVTTSIDSTRRYNNHIYDIIQKAYNATYMQRWTQHYGAVSGQDFSGIQSYIASRASYALSQLPTATAFSAAAGAVSANGAVTITGAAAINVARIEINGVVYDPTWTANAAWSVTVPLASGPNTLNVRALTRDGALIAGASTTLNVSNPNASGWPEIRINEWMADNSGSVLDPADNNNDDWFELHNPTAQPVSLAGWKLSDDPANPGLFTIPANWTIPANGYLLVWADDQTAQNPAPPVANSALHVNFKLNNDGETIVLSAPDNREIDRVAFGEQSNDGVEGRYPDSGAGIAALTVPSPGTANVQAAFSQLNLLTPLPELRITTTPGWSYQIESSADMGTWAPFGAPVLAAGPETTLPVPAAGTRKFVRVKVSR
ncbi:MAG TPA: lamin tail domain-containing protein [Verrucomicrobiales bacterium]|nr:lamin tail domain-containing protein [Verrucomicrobiales bacterium]